MGNAYRVGPRGTARHCHVNKPDTKYNADGLYHYDHVMEGEEAAEYKAVIDKDVDAAWEKITKEMLDEGVKPGELKKWSKYYPYEVETDDDNGGPTGRIIFKFKQNHVIHLKDGSTKTFEVGIRDRKNKEITDNVFGGAIVRPMYFPRPIKMAGLKQIGVRLDFSMVQLIKAAPKGGAGFDEVDDDYASDGKADYGNNPHGEEAEY